MSRTSRPTVVATRATIIATLERFGGNRGQTAAALGIGVRTLGMKLKRWKEDGEFAEAGAE